MNHVKDVMLEPNPKMEFGESIQKTERTKQVLRWEMLDKRVSSNKH